MLKPITIDRVQAALDTLSVHDYDVADLEYFTLLQFDVRAAHIGFPGDTNHFYILGEEDGLDVVGALKQLYGGDSREVLRLDVVLSQDYYEVISQTDILVPGATNADQVHTERRIGRVLR